MIRVELSAVQTLLTLLSKSTESYTSTDLHQLLHIMLSFPFIRELPELSLRQSLCQQLSLTHLRPGEALYSVGEEAVHFYVLLAGKAVTEVPTKKLRQSCKGRKESMLAPTMLATVRAFNSRQKSADYEEKKLERAKHSYWEESSATIEYTVTSTLFPGDFCGEGSFADGSVYQSTILCMENCTFLALDTRYYRSLLHDYAERKNKEYVKLLREIPAFGKWTRKSLGILVSLMTVRNVKREDVIYREGEIAEFVYFIVEGEVKFCKTFGVDEGVMLELAGENLPKRQKSRRLSTPSRTSSITLLSKSQKQLFGHQEILEDCKRRFTCICLSRSATLLELKKQVRNSQDFIRRAQSQDTWNILQRMGEVENSWMETQLQRLQNAEISKLRFALQKSRPVVTVPVRTASPVISHRRTASMTLDSTLTVEGENSLNATHQSVLITRTLKERPNSSPRKRILASRGSVASSTGEKWTRSGSIRDQF